MSSSLAPMVSVQAVHKFFGDLHVLRGIDLTVRSGEVCVILGPSGSGKSTLLRCINQLERISAGRIYVEGDLIGYRETTDSSGQPVLHDLPDKVIAQQRSRIGMVFQRFNLFPHMTALENVMEAPVHVKGVKEKEAQKTALSLLDRVGLADRLSTILRSCPVASSSVLPLRAHLPWTRSCCCSMSRRQPSTLSWLTKCSEL